MQNMQNMQNNNNNNNNYSTQLAAGLGLRGDTLRLGLLPPLRGGRLAWPAPRAWDNPNPALPPYDVKTPHTWSPAYGGYIGRRAYLQDGLCVYLCVCVSAQLKEAPQNTPRGQCDGILATQGRQRDPKK